MRLLLLKIPPCVLRRKDIEFKLTDTYCKIKIIVYSIWSQRPALRHSIDLLLVATGLEDLSHPTLEANIPKTAFSSPKVNLGRSYAGRNVGMFLDRILDTCGSGGKKAHTDMVIAQRHLGQDLCQVNEIHPQPSTLVQSTGCDLQEGTAGRQLHKDDTLQVATS